MNSSKPVLILGKGITGESFRHYFSKKKQSFITYDSRVKKDKFNLKKNPRHNFEKMNFPTISRPNFFQSRGGLEHPPGK